ncbi:unnamed protein product [Enterobius vermicularis]|uniref:Expressed conserved protein n=1 Tax=Enterobius vermicularis TaxID=51028 RepID=A0A0N4VAF9_ENTVE|nr:unnamed protein product [Enterobius vermicularis]
MEYIKICVIEGIRRRRRYRHRRIILRRNLMRQNVVPPSPEVPPPSYDSDSTREVSPSVFVLETDRCLPKYEDALTMENVKPPSYTVAFVCEDLLPPSYERARSHTTYLMGRSPPPERQSSLRRTFSLPHSSSVAVLDVNCPTILDAESLTTDESCHF